MTTNYKDYSLQTSETTGSTLIYKGETLVKCFASDDTTMNLNSIDKAKAFIDANN